MKLICSGPTPARLMFIGEKPGWKEVDEGRPMAGYAGHEFDSMLTEAGINRSDVFVTNVAHEMIQDIPKKIENGFWKIGVAKKAGRTRIDGKFPTDEILRGMEYLPELISRADPDILILCGAIPLWAILRLDGITKWRGSILEYEGRKVIPTYNPAAITRNYSWRNIVVQDFRRVAREAMREEPRKIYYPPRKYIVRPSVDTVLSALRRARGCEITLDIETRGGQISCIGIGFDKNNAICIPFMSVHAEDGCYWSHDDELAITIEMQKTFTDPETKCVFQNGHYDVQYMAYQWGFVPTVSDDTMIMQHCAYPGTRKALDYISSLYCEYYRFWKDDGRNWDPRIHSEEQHWTYNCDDCCYTFECLEVLREILATYKLEEQYAFQMSLFTPVLNMMLRGIKINMKYRNELNGMLLQRISKVSAWFETVLGHPLNPDDNHKYGQMKTLFYGDFKLSPVLHKKTKEPSLDKDSLETLRRQHPILKPLIDRIEEYRSYRVFRSNFVIKELDDDLRMRSSILIPGTESFRFTSSENPWGRGANLQTIPKGTEDD